MWNAKAHGLLLKGLFNRKEGVTNGSLKFDRHCAYALLCCAALHHRLPLVIIGGSFAEEHEAQGESTQDDCLNFRIRYTHVGEGQYDVQEQIIHKLLAEEVAANSANASHAESASDQDHHGNTVSAKAGNNSS